MWVDNLCLVHNAPHKKEALELINYLLEGPVAAGIANTVQYASPNAAAVPYLNSEMLNDPRIYPPPSVQKRLKFNTILDGVTFNDWNRIWTEVKAS